MKKLFLSILLVLFFVISGLCQNFPPVQQNVRQNYYVPNPDQIQLSNITSQQVHNGWARVGNPCAGCPSYWYQVLETSQPYQAEDGIYYYYYYFRFLSNSFYGNGSAAGTYLSQINFYMNGNFITSIQYLLLPSGQLVWGAWMRSQQINSMVSFTVANISVH